MLTPSKDKSISRLEVDHRDGLSQVGQDFVDAVFRHNGRGAPRPAPDVREERPRASSDMSILSQLLDHIDPDCGYQDWLNVLMAMFHETSGSDGGLDLVDAWSRKAGSYKGRADVETKWRSFSSEVAKTLLCLHLIAEAVEQNRIDPGDVYLINADDSSAGIAAKLGLLDELGAHTLVPGQRGFKPEHLAQLIRLYRAHPHSTSKSRYQHRRSVHRSQIWSSHRRRIKMRW